MYKSRIAGIGHYVPDNVVTNQDLEKLMDTSHEWIVERTGIEERRWIHPDSDERPSTMGTEAARMAIKNAGLTPNDIDFILYSTCTRDQPLPNTASILQRKLGIKNPSKFAFER